MREAVVVEADPVTDDARRVLDAFEAVPVNALFLECADHALDHAVLLRVEPSVRHRFEPDGEGGVMNSCLKP
jgi:hypothetical protein